jgi:putative tryptophan/tyrosine transport system substrate-binding protein
MRRREFISLLGGVATWPLTARAQEGRRRRVGMIMIYAETDPEGQVRLSAFRNQLSKAGWTEGVNAQLDVRWATGSRDRMRAAAAELVGIPVDVIVGNSTPLIAILRPLTQTIPIVFTQVADPLGSGFVASYARPGGNITGFTDFDPSIAGKWVEILKEVVPSVSRVTVLTDPEQSNHREFLRALEAAASSFKIEVSAAQVRDRAEIEQAITRLAGQNNCGLVVFPGPVNNTQRGAIIELTARYRLPAIYPFRYYGKEGGLVCYGTDQIDYWPRVAGYVDRILKGEKPADLPVQGPNKFELVVNLKTAKALGLNMPKSLIDRADEVIE